MLTNETVFGLHPVRIMLNRRQVRVQLFAGWESHHYAAAAIERWVDDLIAWLPSIPDLARVDDPSAQR